MRFRDGQDTSLRKFDSIVTFVFTLKHFNKFEIVCNISKTNQAKLELNCQDLEDEELETVKSILTDKAKPKVALENGKFKKTFYLSINNQNHNDLFSLINIAQSD